MLYFRNVGNVNIMREKLKLTQINIFIINVYLPANKLH